MLDPVLFLITNKFHYYPFVGTLPFPFRLLVILYHSSFSSDSHAWSAAPVHLKWTCIYTNVAYEITNLLIFPSMSIRQSNFYTAASSVLTLTFFYTNSLIYQPPIVGIRYDTLTSTGTSEIYIKCPGISRSRPPKLKIVFPLWLPLLLMVAPVESYFCKTETFNI